MNLVKLLKNILADRKFRKCRIWSNRELKKFAGFFNGQIINVSAGLDGDKEGSFYKDYFINSDKYYLSNYKKEDSSFRGHKNEFFLDLEKELDKNLVNKFDVVFNHTTLEHIYDFKKAFLNLCLLTKDTIILVVPFLQQMHAKNGEYGDYWRFTPLAIKKMFEENNMAVLYSSFSNYKNVSVYLFFIASKNPEKWKNKIFNEFNYKCEKDLLDFFESQTGCKAISNSWLFRISSFVKNLVFKKTK